MAFGAFGAFGAFWGLGPLGLQKRPFSVLPALLGSTNVSLGPSGPKPTSNMSRDGYTKAKNGPRKPLIQIGVPGLPGFRKLLKIMLFVVLAVGGSMPCVVVPVDGW